MDCWMNSKSKAVPVLKKTRSTPPVMFLFWHRFSLARFLSLCRMLFTDACRKARSRRTPVMFVDIVSLACFLSRFLSQNFVIYGCTVCRKQTPADKGGQEKKFRTSSPLGVGWSEDLCELFARYYLGPKGRNFFESIGWLVLSGRTALLLKP